MTRGAPDGRISEQQLRPRNRLQSMSASIGYCRPAPSPQFHRRATGARSSSASFTGSPRRFFTAVRTWYRHTSFLPRRPDSSWNRSSTRRSTSTASSAPKARRSSPPAGVEAMGVSRRARHRTPTRCRGAQREPGGVRRLHGEEAARSTRGAAVRVTMSATTLIAYVPASDLAAAGTAQLTVMNPLPGGVSPPASFPITP
jgi:hypothetical protein